MDCGNWASHRAAGTGLPSISTIAKTATSLHTQLAVSQTNSKIPNSASELLGRWQKKDRHVVGPCRQARILLGSSREEIWKAIHLYWAQYVRECLLVAFMWDIWLSIFRRSSFINGCLNLCDYEYIVPIAEMLLTLLCRQIKPVTKTQVVLGNSFSFETQQVFIETKLQVQPF